MLLLILLSITELVQSITFKGPVNTTNGLIRGIISENGAYSMYLGIPYAKVNDANPFGASQPYPQFDGIFDAIYENRVCPQLEEYNHTIVGTLDCLNLNIYVPNKSSFESKLPVIAYVFGGKFSYGFASRVGPYGFMCLDTKDIPGNQGLKDQYTALKWIYENIASFGGDVDKITLSGNSAGAMSIDLHLLNGLPKFYNQVIIQSGSSLSPAIIIPSDYTAPLKLAKKLGFITNDIQEAISFLATSHTDAVIRATLDLRISFRPCVEKTFDKVDRFIDMHPEYKNISHLNITNIKILAGFNSEEELRYNITETIFSDVLKLDFNITDMREMINKVKRFYIGDEAINQKESFEDLVAFASDFIYNNPVQRRIVKYVASGLQVYQYMFSYRGKRNYGMRKFKSTLKGVMHADELGYLFDVSFIRETPRIEDQVMIDKMTTMWTNFVKFGNPTPVTSDLLPVTWIPANKNVMWYLDINSTQSMKKRPYHARLTFWDLFYQTNQDNLLANDNLKRPSSGSTLYFSIMFIPVCELIILLQSYC